jgi:lysozyme family protein
VDDVNARTPIFAAFREFMGGALTAGETAKLDAFLDQFRPRGSAPTADAFAAALTEILRHEGGYADHPKDPGGRTMLGVTQRVWEDWTGKPANEAEMRSLTREKVAPLYRKNYWDAVHGDELPGALALCVFDFAVNAGPSRAARYLQKAVGAAQDGQIGPATLAAVDAYVTNNGVAAAVREFQQARRAYYRHLGTFPTFGKGWLRRVDEVETAALRLI